MTSTSSNSGLSRRPQFWASLDPYVQLVNSLLPRSTGLALFDPRGELQWSSESTLGPDLPAMIQGSLSFATAHPEQAGELALLHGDTPVYVFWLRDDQETLICALAILWRSGEPEARSFAFVHALVRPALECLRRELVASASIDNLNSALSSRDRDLEVLLSASAEGRDGSDSTDDLKSILQSATDHLRCKLTALIVPEKSIVSLSTAGNTTPDTAILAKTHRHLMSLAQLRREPVIINGVGATASQGGDTQAGTAIMSLGYRVLSCPVRHPSGRTMGVLALFRDAGEPEYVEREARLADLLARRAAAMIERNYDSMTGLLTRPTFEQRARGLLAESARGRRWTALYVNTDQLHVVNDNFGMHVGDRIIAQLGELIRTRLMPGAIAARISGDRFAILLPTDVDAACDFADALRQGAMNMGPADGDVRHAISISIGVAQIAEVAVLAEARAEARNAATEFAHVFAAAETACKAAKDRGRNRVELYQESDPSMVRRYEDINIAPNLRAALSENRLRLDAQMILPLHGASGPHAGAAARPHFELLLRMIDDEGETIGPDRFLSAALRYQLMPTVDRWVVQEAIRALKPHAELLAERPVVFTVNLSGQSLGDPEFEDYLIAKLEGSGLNPGIFCFELTESAAIANMAKAELLMRRLRKLGCDVALDDFGTGLSSLAYLRSLPVGMLKIDGSFVRDILKDPRAESMVKAIAHLARSMDLVTVAEYVETDEIRIRVASLGVDYAQGFAIGRPSPLVDLLDQLPLYIAAEPVACGDTLEVTPAAWDESVEVEVEGEALRSPSRFRASL